ncbi:hypothetical protein M2317_002309 [Microbacterium sp. ZKA21]|jgi:hypothetical protein
MVGEGLMIGYVLLGCGVVGAVLATIQAVRSTRRGMQDHAGSR